MTQLRHIVSDESILNLKAVKFMSDDPEAVATMTRSEFYTHLAIRQRMLEADHPDTWEAAYKAEYKVKLVVWSEARNEYERSRRERANA